MLAGRILASKYCLLYELGRGGMGSVWAAEHLTLRTHVAVKLIDPALASSAEVVTRFEREARAAASLSGPHVVQVLDFGVDEGTLFLVMELLNGESLATRLRRSAPLSGLETATIMKQLGRAMTRAHAEGLVHRDLKPDNVFLADDGDEPLVKVLDFGIAKSLASARQPLEESITRSGSLVGTPSYMSAEQAEGKPLDHRSDLWSMGVIAFECVTGQLPFEGESLPALLRAICFDPLVTPSRVAPVPAGFDAWFLRAVAREPAERFQTARELVESLLPSLSAPPSEWLDISSAESADGDTRTLRLDVFAEPRSERRRDGRIPSSIPAGIDRRRDLEHTALIRNLSRTGALLSTRRSCRPGQRLLLTLQSSGALAGTTLSATVLRATPRTGDPIWRLDVGVELETALSEEQLLELESRARRGTG